MTGWWSWWFEPLTARMSTKSDRCLWHDFHFPVEPHTRAPRHLPRRSGVGFMAAGREPGGQSGAGLGQPGERPAPDGQEALGVGGALLGLALGAGEGLVPDGGNALCGHGEPPGGLNFRKVFSHILSSTKVAGKYL